MSLEDAALDRETLAQVEEWSSNSTEAFTVALYQENRLLFEFKPEFTYPVFGDEEAVFGYQDLNISLSFAAHNLKPHLNISYSHKFPDQGEIKASDVRGALKDFLPVTAFSDTSRETALADSSAATFTPPGENLHSYTNSTDGYEYEIWCSSLSDPRAREILQNMQILVPLFIEGGTMLELDHAWITERWKIFFLYRIEREQPTKTASKYALAGYSTAYRVFTFPDRQASPERTLSDANMDEILSSWGADGKEKSSTTSPLDLSSRERISQFVILPPFQSSGHGAHLYNTMYAHLTQPSNVQELTVEDPNEGFDDLRDICDMIHLRNTNPTFSELQVATSIPPAQLSPTAHIPTSEIIPSSTKDSIAKTSKIMTRQLSRLIEMQTLSQIPRLHRSTSRITRKDKSSNEQDRAFYFWRLYVKQRLYVHNRDQLVQLDREERIEKLDQVLEGLQADYERLLAKVDRRMRLMERNGDGIQQSAEEESNGDEKVGRHSIRNKKTKRKHDAVDDDEEEDMNTDEGAVNGNSAAGQSRRKKRNVVVEDEEDDEDDDDEDEDADGEDIADALDEDGVEVG